MKGIYGDGTETDAAGRQARRRDDWLPFGGFVGAFLLGGCALLLDVTTFATNDDTGILLRAVACAAVSLLLLALAWRRMPLPGKLVGWGLIAIAVFVLADAGLRRWLHM